ncbi:hypothetical protein AXX16_1418 [Serratia rubidaea]|nr:hypothetical protein AXX16_1418 [Serratia rubidaea]
MSRFVCRCTFFPRPHAGRPDKSHQVDGCKSLLLRAATGAE